MVEDCEIRLRDHYFVRSSDHVICQANFAAADVLKEWIKENPSGLNFFCDLTSSDSPDAPILSLALFSDSRKGVGGLVSEWCAVLGTLKSNHVDERGGCLGSFRSDL